MSDKKVAKVAKEYYCECCDYKCFNKTNYNKHLQTIKHKYLQNTDKNVLKLEIKFDCICGKSYKHRQSLYTHQNKCNYIVSKEKNSKSDVDFKKMFLEIIKENHELRTMMVEQQKQITELIPKIGNTTNNNTLNQKFNINVFLNEKCRDAIDITDFIKSIKISIEQLDTINTTGMADGLSSAIITNLKSLSVYERPIHCTDIKRETLYIKDDNQWECDRDQTRIKTAIKQIAGKPYIPLQEWITKIQILKK